MSAGMLAVGLPVAAMLALLMGRIAPLSAAIAALALAMFWFLVPGVSIDAALPLPARLLAGIVIVGGWASSGDVGVDYSAEGWLGPLAEARPILTSLVALGCAAALLWLQASPTLARRRPFLWSRLAPSRAQSLYWVQQRHSRRAWRTGLATGRRGPWLRAAVYESAGFAHGYMSPPAIGALVVIWLEMPAWLWLFAGLGFTQRGLQLSTKLLYPLSRIRRAELAWMGTLIDAAVFCAVAGIVLLMTALLPLADLRLPLVAPEANAFNSWPISVGLAFALAPIAQWAVIRWSALENRRAARLGARFVYLMGYVIACALADGAISGTRLAGSPRDTALGVVALAIVVQTVHWFALRSYFTTRDLVRRSI